MQMRHIDPTRFHVATRGTSRRINRQIALTLIGSHQPISRADLARRMKLRRGAVGLLVQDLLDARHIIEGLYARSRFDGAGKMMRAVELLDEAGFALPG